MCVSGSNKQNADEGSNEGEEPLYDRWRLFVGGCTDAEPVRDRFGEVGEDILWDVGVEVVIDIEVETVEDRFLHGGLWSSCPA